MTGFFRYYNNNLHRGSLWLLLLYLPLLATAQIQTGGEKLNQTDSSGNKHGKYLEYLGSTWGPVKEIKDARFSRYAYYDHGFLLSVRGTTYSAGDRLTVNGQEAESAEGLRMLNGRYCWYNKKGFLKEIVTYKDGELVTDSVYYPRKSVKTAADKLSVIYDNTNKFQKQQHSWYMESYDKEGRVNFKGYFRRYAVLDYKTGERKPVWGVYGE